MYMRHYTHFSSIERMELSILRAKGYSVRSVSRALGRSPSSVSREMRRNKVLGEYVPRKAHQKARTRRNQSKYQGMKVREHPELEAYIAEKLPLGWSPDVIAGCWTNERAKQCGVTITAKGIYKYLYSAYGQRFCPFLKYKRYGRRRRKQKVQKVLIPARVLIDERPAVIGKRLRYGDFEADTMGIPKGTRATLAVAVERKSRFILARKISRLKFAMNGFKELFAGLPACSITFDNGVENTRHRELGVPTYFCHPYSSWEKGSVENAIGALRWFIPKRSDVARYSEDYISAIVEHINRIPRKSLGYRTPEAVFSERFLKAGCCTSG